MYSLSAYLDEAQNQPQQSPSKGLKDTNSESHSETESEYEQSLSQLRRHRNVASSVGDRLVKRRRADRSEAPPRSVSPPSTSIPKQSSEADGDVSEEESQPSTSSTASNAILKWENIPYPGLPQPGYAFSYASGPICFLKVPTSASKLLAVHWRPPQNYVAYIIYSLHPAPHMDNKHEGLAMVNELAAQGFVENDECDVHEETVQAMRALSFKKGGIVVIIPKLGDMTTFKDYWPWSKVDEDDRKKISEKLQSVMHDRALPNLSPRSTTSSCSTRSSDESELGGTSLPGSDSGVESSGGSGSGGSGSGGSGSSGRDVSLEDSNLIKFVKVHWRQSKWIVDNIRLLRSPQYTDLRARTKSETTADGHANFRAVVIWSNKDERKEGVNLLERIIATKLGGHTNDCMKDVMVCQENMEDGELWMVYHKNKVVVAFPGLKGEAAFLDSVKAMGLVWA